MRSLVVTVMLVALAALPACRNKSENAMAEVPPPPPLPESSVDQMPPPTIADSGAAQYTAMPAAPAGTAVSGSTYTVQKGDTLWSIAQRFYGDGKKWQDIAAANNNLDPKKLAVGQTLILP